MEKLTTAQIIEALKTMTGMELVELSKQIQEVFGIDAMPTMSAGAPAEAAGGGATEFDVKVTSAGTSKMDFIKLVRGLKSELGLKEAKDYVEDESRKTIGELLGKTFKDSEAKQLVEELGKIGVQAQIISK